MTTVAYRDGIMASDSSITRANGHVCDAQKVWRLPDGSLFGGSGEWASVLRALEDLRKQPTRRKLSFTSGSMSGLLVRPTGHIFAIDQPSGHVYRIRGRVHAIGSGQEYAFGAMEAGATAREAVAAACRRDGASKGPVQWKRL